jgi:formamidopyrimidine-DNA glycosylase
MPELPEVETVRRGLMPVLAGRRIAAAEIRRPDLRRPLPPGLAARLAGARVEAIGRRAKVLLIDLEGGDTLLVHLGMSGRMRVAGRLLGDDRHGGGAGAPEAHDAGAPGAHDHVVLTTEEGLRITFNDARRFGDMDLWPTARLREHRMLAGLGPEPLGGEFGAETLARAFRGKARPVKAALLDQRVVAGLGNIYAAEALHRAGIDPRRAAGRIGAARLARLAAAIREVLGEAIEAGGSSLRDHRRPDGEIGAFQLAFRVYAREGAPCPRAGCGGAVRRLVQAGRSTFYCPRCQR